MNTWTQTPPAQNDTNGTPRKKELVLLSPPFPFDPLVFGESSADVNFVFNSSSSSSSPVALYDDNGRGEGEGEVLLPEGIP